MRDFGVCRAIDAVKYLDDDEKNKVILNHPKKRGNPNKTIINQADLYSLILWSQYNESDFPLNPSSYIAMYPFALPTRFNLERGMTLAWGDND